MYTLTYFTRHAADDPNGQRRSSRLFFYLFRLIWFSSLSSSYKPSLHLPCSFPQVVLCSLPQSRNFSSSGFISCQQRNWIPYIQIGTNKSRWKKEWTSTRSLPWCDHRHVIFLPGLNSCFQMHGNIHLKTEIKKGGGISSDLGRNSRKSFNFSGSYLHVSHFS